MAKTIDYDPQTKTLFVHKGLETGEEFLGNFGSDDLVVDITTKGRIVGLETLSDQPLTSIGITDSILQRAKNIDFTASIDHNNILLTLIVQTETTIEKQIKIPLVEEELEALSQCIPAKPGISSDETLKTTNHLTY